MVKQNFKINEKKCLSKILWGEKWKDMKRMLLLLLPKATKYGTFQGPPSRMFPHWPPSIRFISKATKYGTFQRSPSKMFPHWPPSIGFISKATKYGTFQGSLNFEPSIGHQVVVFLRLLFSSFL